MSEAPPPFELSDRQKRTVQQPIGYLMAQAVENPGLISLAAGLVDYPTLPSREVAELSARLLTPESPAAKPPLQYGTTAGHAGLRSALLAHLAQLDGVPVDHYGATAKNVVVTTGSQQLLYLLTEVLVNPGDIVITAWPSYFVYTGALRTFGAEVRTVDSDDDGLIPESLEAMLAAIEAEGRLDRVKIVYTVTYHKNPTGRTLHASRRPRVLEAVQRYSKKHRILLLEDAAYRELTYDGVAPPTIKSLDKDNSTVALAMTFSKPFSPGLKTGYGLLPDDLIEPVLLQKGSQDFGSPNFCQSILHEAMISGAYAQHVKRLCERYAQKRDAMLAALDQHFSDRGATWTRPQGGLYVWLTLPEAIDTGPDATYFKQCLAEGVIYVPGVFCYPADPNRTAPTNCIRLSFGTPSIEDIHEGVARMARALPI